MEISTYLSTANFTRKLFVADEISTFRANKSKTLTKKYNLHFRILQTDQLANKSKARKSEKKEPVYSVLDQLTHLVEHWIFTTVCQV